jgi:ABC-type Zn uptake system ZnuABC Zn-binding protein ZnuA
MTQTILDGLTRLAPDARDVFARNRARFLERLDAGLARWTAALAPYRGARVVVFHDSWPYFARRFGLVIAATVEPVPGVPPSPASLAALTAGMREAGVRVLIVEPSSNRSVANRIAASTGARIVTLVASVGGDTEAGDYVTLFEVNVRRLAAALAGVR